MSDSEEESNNSEKNWPMNEDWMLDILKDDDKSDAKVKIIVNQWQHFRLAQFLLTRIYGNAT